jgi:hypothetical protein
VSSDAFSWPFFYFIFFSLEIENTTNTAQHIQSHTHTQVMDDWAKGLDVIESSIKNIFSNVVACTAVAAAIQCDVDQPQFSYFHRKIKTLEKQ